MPTKSKARALGDDPLAWMLNDTDTKDNKKTEAHTTNSVDCFDEVAVSDLDKQAGVSSCDLTTEKPEKTKADSVGSHGSSGSLSLDSVVTASQARKLKEMLLSFLADKPSTVEIDASRVENIDTSALQLLLAFSLDVKKKGCELTWMNVPSPMFQRIQVLGLLEKFGLKEVAE